MLSPGSPADGSSILFLGHPHDRQTGHHTPDSFEVNSLASPCQIDVAVNKTPNPPSASQQYSPNNISVQQSDRRYRDRHCSQGPGPIHTFPQTRTARPPRPANGSVQYRKFEQHPPHTSRLIHSSKIAMRN